MRICRCVGNIVIPACNEVRWMGKKEERKKLRTNSFFNYGLYSNHIWTWSLTFGVSQMYNTKAAKIIDLTKNSNSVDEIRMSSCPKIVGRRYDFDLISTGNINFSNFRSGDKITRFRTKYQCWKDWELNFCSESVERQLIEDKLRKRQILEIISWI